mmetsp:Transcript_31551/g.60246  ORF Transcript_31551/g.60246 Transcript_31551/m.60246 type:complete len:450 (-) Transcript_31551:1356-2705(-)
MQSTIPRGGDAQFSPSLRHVYHIIKHGILAQYAQIGPFQPRSILEDKSHGVQQPTSRAAHRQLGAMSLYGSTAQHGVKCRIASTSQRDASQQQIVSRMRKLDDGRMSVEGRREGGGRKVVSGRDPVSRAGEGTVEFLQHLGFVGTRVNVVVVGALVLVRVVLLDALAIPFRRLPRRRTTAQRSKIARPISPSMPPSSRIIAALHPPTTRSRTAHRARWTRLQPLVPLECITVRSHQRQAVHQLRRHIIRKRTPNPAHLLVHEAHAQYVPGPQGNAFHGAEGRKYRVLVEHLLLGSVIPQSGAEEGEVGLGFVDGIHDGLERRLDVHGDEVVLLEFLAAMIVVVAVVRGVGGCVFLLAVIVVIIFMSIASRSVSPTPPPPPQCTSSNSPTLLLLLIPFDPGQGAGQRGRQSQQQQVGSVLAYDHTGRVGGMRSQDVGIAVLLGPRPVLVG